MKQFVVAAVLVTFASISHAQTVVSDTNLSITLDNSFPPSDYRGTIWQDAAKSNPTSIWFNYDGLKITFGTTMLMRGQTGTLSIPAMSSAKRTSKLTCFLSSLKPLVRP